jgi:ribosome-binding factor A
MSRRTDRVNGLLRQEISRVIATEIKDDRLPDLISVTKVEVSSDLRAAKVFISVLGDDSDKAVALKVLRSATGFVHRVLRKRLNLKHVPILEFRLDESIERDIEFQRLISQMVSTSDSDIEKNLDDCSNT